MNRSKEILLDQFKNSLDKFFYNMKHISQQAHSQGMLAEAQSFLMHVLWAHGPSKISDIAQIIGITNGAVTQMADKLLEMKLISRERSEDDRRVVWLSLTEKGVHTVQEIQTLRFKYVSDHLRDLSEDDLEQIINIFDKLNNQLDVIEEKE